MLDPQQQRKDLFKKFILSHRRSRESTHEFARRLNHQPQKISSWLGEDPPDPLNFRLIHIRQLAIALNMEPKDLAGWMLSLDEDGKEEFSIEDEDSPQKELREAEKAIQCLEQFIYSHKSMHRQAFRLSRFLQALLSEHELNWKVGSDLETFAFKPNHYGEEQWEEADIIPAGRLWQLIAGKIEEPNELDYARLTVCVQYLTGLEYCADDLVAIANGLSPDELRPEPFEFAQCSKCEC